MSRPERAAEQARIAHLLYTRLEPDERARLEAEYHALADQPSEVARPTATPAEVKADAGADVEQTIHGFEEPASLPREARSRRLPLGIAAAMLIALGLGVAAGWALSPHGEGARADAVVRSSEVPVLVATSAAQPRSQLLNVFYRPQVVAPNESSDVPKIDVGTAYEPETFRHLLALPTLGTSTTIVGSAYAVVRKSDQHVCLMIVSRTAFVASSCVDQGDIPDSGIVMSVRLQSAVYEVSWQASVGAIVSVSR